MNISNYIAMGTGFLLTLVIGKFLIPELRRLKAGQEILAGMEDTATPYAVVENRVEAIRYAMDHAQPGDVIVLCGKGHETYQIIGHEKHHLDEREVVAEHLAAE